VGAFSDAAVTAADYIDGGHYVVGQFSGTGTNDGPLGPMPATGRRMTASFCEIMRYNASGQIVSGSLYYDQITILSQLGRMEAAGD
jgi:hypothetical protein